MNRINQVIKRMRWKAFFYVNRSEDNTQGIFGLKTLNCTPKSIILFEKDVWNLANKLKFPKIRSNFQRRVDEHIRVIRLLNKVLVFADKTSNISKLVTDECKKLTTSHSIN